jgi:hypothetical protein
MPESQIYQLFLSSKTGFPGLLDNTNSANVSYQVDWDAFFQRQQYNYKYCRLRVKYVSNASTSLSYQSNGSVLVAQGLASAYTSKNTVGLPLGLITCEQGVNAGANDRGYLLCDTTQESGLQINIPSGNQQFFLQIWRDGYGCIGSAQDVLYLYYADWSCILTFELYN